jgi:hypothetical protein
VTQKEPCVSGTQLLYISCLWLFQAGVQHSDSGTHDIEREITSGENEKIIIHDSGGFEASETENFEKIVDFIKERRKRGNLAENLHCIW